MRKTLREMGRTFLLFAGLVLAFVLIAFVLYPAIGLLPSILIGLAVLFSSVRAYTMGYRYLCSNCGTMFKVPLTVDFLTQSGIGKNADGTYYTFKRLTCPSCGKVSKAVVIRRRLVDEVAAQADEAAPAAEPPAPPRRPQRKKGGKRRR